MTNRSLILYGNSLLIGLLTSIPLIRFFYPLRLIPLWVTILSIVMMSYAIKHLISGQLYTTLASLPKHKQWATVLFTAFLSVAFLLSTKGSQTYLNDSSLMTKIGIFLGAFLGLWIILLWLIQFLLNVTIELKDVKVTKMIIVWYALPLIFVWTFYLVAFYPGTMSPDSLIQWSQAHTHHFNDWHPVIYTWLIMAMISVWPSPAAVAITQIVATAFIFGYAMYSFTRAGVKPLFLIMMTSLIALNPVIGVYTITIWKDILYSGFLVLFSIYLFNIYRTKGKWLDSTFHNSLLVITALLFSLFRNNGFPVALVIFILLAVMYRHYVKRIALIFMLLIILFFGITGPLFNVLNVERPDPNEALSIPTQQIANVIKHNGKLTSEQVSYYNKILPIPQWKKLYDPYLTDPIKFSKYYNQKVIFSDPTTYVKNWIQLCIDNPKLVLSAYLKQTSIVWQIHQPNDGYSSAYLITIHKNNFGIKRVNPLPFLTNQLTAILSATNTQFKMLFWRPALFLFLMLFFTFVGYLKNNRRIWLIAMPVLLNTGTILAGLPAQDFRYLYSELLLSYLLFVTMFLTHSWRVENYE